MTLPNLPSPKCPVSGVHSRYFKLFSTNSNVNGYQVDNLPLAAPCHGIEVIDKVSRILLTAKDTNYISNPNKQAKVREIEQEIDQIVYKLYGLTPEDIAVVEGSFPQKQ